MRTQRFKLVRKSNPSKPLATITVRGKTKKALQRNVTAVAKRLHLKVVQKRDQAKGKKGKKR